MQLAIYSNLFLSMSCYSIVLYVSWTEATYSVGEEDGLVQVCLQLTDVQEPTEEDVWVSVFTLDGEVATGKAVLAC